MAVTFDQAYRKLNPAQRRAVDTIEGPVMVVAGPGTGKTQVLAARIAAILQRTDTQPRSVLALTYTESAAQNMRQRLVELIGPTGYYVQIHTFHAFCGSIMKEYPEYFTLDRDSEPLGELERYRILEDILSHDTFEALKPLNQPFFYIKDLIGAISDLKREGVSPNDLHELVTAEAELTEEDLKTSTAWKRHQSLLARHTELIDVYTMYQKYLGEHGRFDFDDMIMLVAAALQTNELLLLQLQENIQYFLVDEFQDTNSAQLNVIELLASFWGEAANVFVVGDPNQSIFRFQGASVENVLRFTQLYPQAEIITLDQGYRCPQSLYTIAQESIKHNHLGIASALGVQMQLHSEYDVSDPIDVNEYSSTTLEQVGIAEKIRTMIDSGVDASGIAVLCKKNQQLWQLAQVFDRYGIGYDIDGGFNVLEDKQVDQFLRLLEVLQQIIQGDDAHEIFDVMRYGWLGLDSVPVMKLGRLAGQKKVPIVQLLAMEPEELQAEAKGTGLGPELLEQLQHFYLKLNGWGQREAELVFTEWFAQVLKESGYLEWLKKQSSGVELLTAMHSLFAYIKSAVEFNHRYSLNDFLTDLALMREHTIKISLEDLNVRHGVVKLSTVHKAKGQEWEYVFLPWMIDGNWGNGRTPNHLPLPEGVLTQTKLDAKEKNEDDRRLFYVGITRAKKKVFLSYAQTNTTNGQNKATSPAMFIAEINELPGVTTTVAASSAEGAQQALETLLQPIPVDTASTEKLHDSFQEYLHHMLESFSLSVTALNTYLRDPHEFLNNVLLRVPRAKEEPMAYGTAMHHALEKMYRPLTEGKKSLAPLQDVVVDFEYSLRRELLDSKLLRRRLTKGIEEITHFYEHYAETNPQPVFVERMFGGASSKVMLGDVALVGRIDRIDWIDEREKTVRVIDYKTGRPKSANEIEGAVASQGLSEREQLLPDAIKGPYKRQLLFYKLLAELDTTFIPTVTLGAFAFLQPSSSGTLVYREFELLQSDVDELKQLITDVMKEIKNLEPYFASVIL